MELYVKEFNLMNHSNLKQEDLFCSKCTKVFITEIYTIVCEDEAENENYCEPCYKSEDLESKGLMVVNHFLKKYLRTARFPCIFEQCNFTDGYSMFQKHVPICVFGPTPPVNVTCPMDKELFHDAALFLEHLSGHENVKKIVLDSLSITIELDLEEKLDHIIVADYKNHYFLVFIKFLDETVSIKVGKHLFGPNAESMPFTIIYQFENIEMRLHGIQHPLETVINSGENGDGLLLSTSLLHKNTEINMYFANYEMVKNTVASCPICFKLLLSDVKQCTNAHFVCVTCASETENECSVCRVQMIDPIINLKRILPDYEFPCENFDDGCAELVKPSDMHKHNMVCAFRRIKCPECWMEYRAHNFCAHVRDKHEHVRNNFENLGINRSKVLFRSNIFELSILNSNTCKSLKLNEKTLPKGWGAVWYKIELLKNSKCIQELLCESNVEYSCGSGFDKLSIAIFRK